MGADLSESNLQLALAMNPPASLIAGWFVMLIAMMLPLLWGALQHVRQRSFPNYRIKTLGLFLVSYGLVWMTAGLILLSTTMLLRLTMPDSILPLLGVVMVALIWQFSPAKQYCLNRCHSLPALNAFGFAAYNDALKFGFKHGMWCVGSCWALMLIPLMVYQGHIGCMLLVTLWLLSERLDRAAVPQWQMRVPVKALRMVIAQIKLIAITLLNKRASLVGYNTQSG